MSCTPTTSASHELVVLIFCFFDALVIALLPSESVPPMWLFMSGCAAYDASTHHFTTSIPYAPRVRQSPSVPLRKPIRQTNFSQSSSSGDFTRVVREAIVACMSGLDRLLMNRSFATYQWKSCARSSLSFFPFGFTVSR